MGRHTAPRRRTAGRWFGRGRTRALLALGTVFALGAVGTSAYWTDTATVDGSAIASGTLDLQLQTPASGSSWIHTGTGTSTTDTSLTIAGLAPNESVAFAFAVRNVGNPNLAYTVTVAQGSSWTYVSNPLQVRFYTGATPSNVSTYPRTGSCPSGTAQGAGMTTVTSTATTVVASRSLAGGGSASTSGASETLCLVVQLSASADNSNQGKTGTIQLVFKGDQA